MNKKFFVTMNGGTKILDSLDDALNFIKKEWKEHTCFVNIKPVDMDSNYMKRGMKDEK